MTYYELVENKDGGIDLYVSLDNNFKILTGSKDGSLDFWQRMEGLSKLAQKSIKSICNCQNPNTSPSNCPKHYGITKYDECKLITSPERDKAGG